MTTKNIKHFGTLILIITLVWLGCSLDKLDPSVKYDPCLGKVTSKFSHDKIGVTCDSPCVVKFTNQSTGAKSYAWNFGEGGTSTEVNPTYTFKKTGRFEVKLTATGDNGCSKESTETVTVSNTNAPDPIPDFTFTLLNNNQFAPTTVVFTNTSQNAVSYKWDFGDNQGTSIMIAPQHLFTVADDFTVKLEATNTVGVKKQITKTISIKAITFKKGFGNVGSNSGRDIVQLTNDGYAIVGNQSGAGSPNLYLLYTDSRGNLNWDKQLYLLSWGIGGGGRSVLQAIDGDIVGFGFSLAGAPGDDMFLVKYKLDGNEIWRKQIGGMKADQGNSIGKTSDNGYILCGTSASQGNGKNDIYLAKTNAFGVIEWAKTFGDTANDIGIRAKQTNDGGFIIFGTITKTQTVTPSLIKTDRLGNHLWTKVINNNNTFYNSILTDMTQTLDGGYIFCGNKGVAASNTDANLVKTDSMGNIQWQQTYGSLKTDEAYSVQQCKDGGYIVCGRTYLQNTNGDIYIIRTDIGGNLLWEKTFSQGRYSLAYAVKQTSDGGFIIAGYAGDTYDYVYIIKTDKNGNVQ